MTLQLRIAARMDVGMVRDHQEDDYAIASDLSSDHWGFIKNESIIPGSLGTLLLVADGMGGANAGEVASNTAVQGAKYFFAKLRELGLEAAQLPKTIAELLSDAILNAHHHILRKAEQSPETKGMGTTIVLAWIIDQTAHVAWVGDSRCYLMSAKKGLLAISKDHSFVQQLIDRGELNEADAFLHPHRNVILQSLGGTAQVPQPSYTQVQLEPGDRLLLCSDGLNTMLPDLAIQTILAQEFNTDDCVRKLIQATNEAGGRDNITVVLADVVSDKPVTYPLPAAPMSQAKLDTEINQQPDPPVFQHQPLTDLPPRKRQIWPGILMLLAFAGTIALLYWANIVKLKDTQVVDTNKGDPSEYFSIKVKQRDSIEAAQNAKVDSLAEENKNKQLSHKDSTALEHLENAAPKTPSNTVSPGTPGTFVLSYNYGTRRSEAQKQKKVLAQKINSKYTVLISTSTNCGQSTDQKVDSCYEVIIRTFNSRMAADSFKSKTPALRLFTPKRDRPNTK